MERKILIKDISKKITTKTKEEIDKENLDLFQAFENETKEKAMNEETLNALKAKLAQKQIAEKEEEEVPELITKQEVSINMGIVGIGQAGGRIAEVFHKLRI